MDRGNFIGKEALAKQREAGIKRKLVIFSLEDPEPLIYHEEPIYRNGKLVSINTHGSFAHFLGSSIGMGYLENPEGIDNEWILSGKYEIEVERKKFPAKAHIRAPHDPDGKRLRM
jgi:4-methylaminobutanoate oxidase (formaldehyde-forming)